MQILPPLQKRLEEVFLSISLLLAMSLIFLGTFSLFQSVFRFSKAGLAFVDEFV